MIFVFGDGNAPIVHPFIDENDRNIMVNGTCYLDLLNEAIWPTFPPTPTFTLCVLEYKIKHSYSAHYYYLK